MAGENQNKQHDFNIFIIIIEHSYLLQNIDLGGIIR